MSEPFNLEQFRDAFEVTTKVKNKLQPFLAKFKEHNMNWIVRAFQELHRLFYDDKVEAHMKFNSIFGIKFIFDLGDVILINLIEVFFLPKILQVACYETNLANQKRGVSYFAMNGYPKDTPDIQKFGYNFVRMASEFVNTAAIVKPNRLFQGEEINEPSQYALALRKLHQIGWKPYPTPVYYKEGMAENIRKHYLNSLQNIDANIDQYINFFQDIFKKFVEEDKMYKGRISPFKIIEFGDTYLTAAVVALCEEQFADQSFKRRKNALYLLNELIKWGDIEAAHLVNCTPFIDQTIKQIANPNLSTKTLNRGKSFYQKNKSAENIKQQFYVEVLKNIQFWALCYPRAMKIKNRQSKIKFIHDELRNKLQLEFPQDRQLRQKKTIFDKASQKHKKRNQKLLRQLKENDDDLVPIVQSSRSIPSGKMQKPIIRKSTESEVKHEETPSGAALGAPTSDYQRLKRQINQINATIDTLCDSEGRVDTKISRITQFKKNYEKQLQTANLSDDQFDEIFGKADLLIERINKIDPHIAKYSAKKIGFQELSDLIHNRKHSPQKSSSIKQLKGLESKKEFPPSVQNIQASNLPKLEGVQLKSSVRIKKQGQKQTSVLQSNYRPESKKNAAPSSQHSLAEITPIKQVRQHFQDNEKFNDSKDMSSLPQNSRQSMELSRKEIQQAGRMSRPVVSSKKLLLQDEDMNIQPASHTIIDNSKVSLKAERVSRDAVQKIGDIKKSLPKILQSDSPGKHASQSVSRQLLESDHNLRRDLEEEVQYNIGIHIPKSIKNAAGSYKLHQSRQRQPQAHQKGHISAPMDRQSRTILQQSRKSSSKIKFQQSRLSQPQMLEQDDNDIIMMPDANPLQMSYHDIGNTTEDIFKYSKELSFKKCFEEDKFLYGPDRQNKKFKLANDTFNLIKRSDSNARRHSRNKDSSISIPSILNERNKKYEQELKYVQEKKNRKISELQGKIKMLESSGSVMKQKLVQQQRQIKSIKAYSEADQSRVKKNNILEDQDAIYKAKLASAHNRSVKQRSFYNQSMKQPKYLDPMGKLINSRKYNSFFQQFKAQKQKKTLLKSKQLLLKNDDIQFGCMSRRNHDILIVTFFITPAVDLDGLMARIVSNDSELGIQIQPKNVPSIRRGKQEKIQVSVHVKDIPYYLPQIEFRYNLDHKLDSQKFTVPCAFHKFIHLTHPDQRQFTRQFSSSDKILRGQQVPYSKKLLKNLSNLSDYFSGGVILRQGEPNHNGEIQFGGRAQWKGEQFWIRIMVRPNQFLYVQTVASRQNLLQEYYVALVTNLLMKNIQLKEM